jgi:iron complex outermembrane recepter protein
MSMNCSTRERAHRRGALWLVFALTTSMAGAADKPTQFAAVTELKKLSLEELVETPVISASRVPEPWFTTPFAIDVQTEDDIRRIGAVRLAETLRYITGLEVARNFGSAYAISARGFNSIYGNKLQVMMDGRTLYTPLFSGVFWEVQDTFLEDLDRIEVVRGPGASLWGANAVNGVVNIVSKSARDTQGLLVMGGGGNEERGFGGVRYGGQLSENSFYRVYVKHLYRDAQALHNGNDAADEMWQTQVGFRTDSFLHDIDQLTIQGDTYVNEYGVRGPRESENDGANILGRWKRDLADYGQLVVQTYYDHGRRDVPLQFYEDRETFDIDAQHHFVLRERQSIVWGGGYRISWDDTGQRNRTFRFDPSERTINCVSGFISDEITLLPDLLKATLGSHFEHNSFSGFEIQPSGRFTITPNERHTIWGAVSRAVRSPTRGEEDLRFSPSPTGFPVVLRGHRDFKSEELLAYEVGYRVQVVKKLSVDITGFYNDYDKLRTQEPRGTPFPLVLMNERHGETYGGEVAVKAHLTEWARISASYSRIEQDLRFSRLSGDSTGGSAEGNDPSDFAVLRLSFDLPHDVEIDLFGRYMDALPNPRVPGYFAIDARIGWRPSPNFEISVVGQNLNDPQHREFGGPTFPEVERSVFAKATVRF